MPLEVVYGSSGRPVTLAEAKLHCRVDADISEDNDYVLSLVDTATRFVEEEIWGTRQIMAAQYDLPMCDWWEGQWCLPRPPLQSVTGVYYYDTSGTEQTLSTSIYTVRKPWRQPGTVELAYNQNWPATQGREFPIRIRFVAGYVAPVSVDATTNVFTSTGRAFSDGDRVRFYTTGSDLPAGLSESTDYYVVSASSQTFKVSTTVGGSEVDVTDAGTGRHMCGWIPATLRQAVLLLVGHWYRNREATITGTISKELELTVKSLLEVEGWGSYA